MKLLWIDSAYVLFCESCKYIESDRIKSCLEALHSNDSSTMNSHLPNTANWMPKCRYGFLSDAGISDLRMSLKMFTVMPDSQRIESVEHGIEISGSLIDLALVDANAIPTAALLLEPQCRD